MSRRDTYVLGLLALAYWYLDSRPATRGARADHERVTSFPDGLASLSACPRRAWHPVSRRPDGAIWCRGCDEAFFPRAAEWEEALAGAAA